MTWKRKWTWRRSPRWGLAQRIVFRFLFSYFVLFFLTGEELWSLSFLAPLIEKYTSLWHAVAVWVGRHVFDISYEIPLDGQGAGDTTFRWLLLPCYLAKPPASNRQEGRSTFVTG